MVLCGAWSVSALAGGTNLIRNVEFEGDGLGGCLNWSVRGGLEDTVRVLPGEGPDGCGAVRVNVPRGYRFSQDGIRLAAGEDYRVGVWVRTSGLDEGAFRFMVWNDWWKDEQVVANLPADTQGRWMKLEWQGKMIPASKTSLYNFGFYLNAGKKSGEFDVAAPYIEPLSDQAREKSAPAKEMLPVRGRIVPVAPRLFDIDAENSEISFYFPYDTEHPLGSYAIEATVDGDVSVRTKLSEDRTANVRFGSLAVGAHRLSVRLVDADGRVAVSNEYPMAVVSHRYPQGRRLNNFVTELFRGEVKAGPVRYMNPRTGWVWCELKPSSGGDPVVEMRNFPAGERTYAASADGFLRIHAVKTLLGSSVPSPLGCYDWKRYTYGGAWYMKHEFPLLNTCFAYGFTPEKPWAGTYKDAGRIIGPEIGISGEAFASAAILRSHVTDSAAFRAGLDIEVDEHAILNSRTAHYVTAEELWKVVDRPSAVNIFWSDIMNNVFFDKAGLASEIAAIANTGRGRGMLFSETYFSGLDDWTAAARQVEHYADVIDSLRKISPMAPSALLLCFGGYIEQGGWNNYSSPYVDMKVLYDHFMHCIATDPRFAEVGGTGLTAQHHFDEEMMRWFLMAFRHYFLEGKTELLSPKFDFTYRPGHLSNADFENGLEGWKALPADGGAIVATNVAGYALKYQARKDVPDGYGDTLACFTRSAVRPNLLVGRLTGLRPGRLYSVMYYANDPAELADPGSVGMDFPFAVAVRRGEAVPSHAYKRQWPPDRQPDGFRLGSKTKYPIRITGHFLFRATSEEDDLVFSDWTSSTRGGAAAGRQTYLNGVRVRPYYDVGAEGLDK